MPDNQLARGNQSKSTRGPRDGTDGEGRWGGIHKKEFSLLKEIRTLQMILSKKYKY